MNIIDDLFLSDNGIKAFETVLEFNQDNTLTDHEHDKWRRILLQVFMFLISDLAWETIIQEKDIHAMVETFLQDERVNSINKIGFGALIRIILETDWVDNQKRRPIILSAFEKNAPDQLLKEWKVNPGDMGHEKVNAIRSGAQRSYREFETSIHLPSNIDSIIKMRNKVLPALKKPGGQALIVPFLPDHTETDVSEMFDLLEEYRDSLETLDVVDSFDKLFLAINKFIKNNREIKSSYGAMLTEHFGEKIRDFIDKDFVNNKAAQPSSLRASLGDKKYPFHKKNHKTYVRFVIDNDGPGFAYKVNLSVIFLEDDVLLIEDKSHLGRIAPNLRHNVDLPILIQNPTSNVKGTAVLEWRNYKGEKQEISFDFQCDAQRTDVDWDRLQTLDPYSLEPIQSKDELIGRADTLNRLIGTSEASNVGSSIIFGQKRVGKTSIAKALGSNLEERGFLVIYLEGGDYVEPTPDDTIARLGRRLCWMIQRKEKGLSHISIPDFNNALSPISEFLDQVEDTYPDKKIVFILDEFDELPVDLYSRGSFGNAFFLTLRSISSRSNVGFVLVGGEKINFIMEHQGDKLNKWKTLKVDYFSREDDWLDYRELITRPVTGMIDYSEEAIQRIFNVSAGNPYFTKLICGSVYQSVIDRRDCHISEAEVEDEINKVIYEISINTFQHFWEDGLVGNERETLEKSIDRRRILLAISETLSEDPPALIEKVKGQQIVDPVTSLEGILQEFLSRNILRRNAENAYEFKIELFERWLRIKGVFEVISSFPHLDAELKKRKDQERIIIRSEEITKLTDGWTSYKGEKINEDRVRRWLSQFASVENQRAMFTVLEHLNFYSQIRVREKLQEIHDIVTRDLGRSKSRRQVKRGDILISYLDGPGKSGAHLANLYADESRIYVGNVVEKSELANRLIEPGEIKAIVFVDDFVGTGNSIVEYLTTLDPIVGERINERNIRTVFSCIVAYKQGWEKLEEFMDKLPFKLHLHACEFLDQTDQVFNEANSPYKDDSDRISAKQLAKRHGEQIERKWPLGFGNLELAVVFEHGCPNNSLPILWGESTGDFNWIPLFRRH